MHAREVAGRGTSIVPAAPSAPRQSPASQPTAALATEIERSPAAVVSIRVELMGQPAERVDRAPDQRRAQQQASERAALTRRPQSTQTFRTATQAPRIVIVDQPAESQSAGDKLPQLDAYAGPDARGGASSQPSAAEQLAAFGGERAVAAYAQQRSWDAPAHQLLDLRA